MNDDDSKHLIDRYQHGDGDAAKQLFDRYVSRLITLVHRRMTRKLNRRIDAEDIVQSAFRSFFSGLDREKFNFDESGDLWNLLVVISLNKLRRKIKYHQADKRRFDSEQSLPADSCSGAMLKPLHFEAVSHQPLPETAAVVMDEFQKLIVDLEPIHVEMLELRMQGYMIEEIATSVGRSERTVRRVIDRVRTQWSENAVEQFAE